MSCPHSHSDSACSICMGIPARRVQVRPTPEFPRFNIPTSTRTPKCRKCGCFGHNAKECNRG